MKALDIIKKVAGVGITIGSIASPQVAEISKVISDAILAAESMPGKKGIEKAVAAQAIVSKSLPASIAAYEALFGRQIVDEALLAEALKDQQEATVKLYKAFGLL